MPRISFGEPGPANGTVGGFEDLVVEFGIEGLRNQAATPMHRDAQELMDRRVVEAGRQGLVLVDYLVSKGLTTPLADPMSVLELTWHRRSVAGAAQRVMLPEAIGDASRQVVDTKTLPIYLTMEHFNFNVRELASARRSGVPLDTGMAFEATYNVNKNIEQAAILGATDLQVNGNTVPGIVNAPSVNYQATISARAWDNASHTGQNILDDVMAAIDKLQTADRNGPYCLLLTTKWGNKLEQDFSTAKGNNTIRQRLQAIQVGNNVSLDIKIVPGMKADTAVLFEVSKDVIELIVGQTPTLVSWADSNNWRRWWAVLAFIIPRIRDTYDSRSGICVLNKTGAAE